MGKERAREAQRPRQRRGGVSGLKIASAILAVLIVISLILALVLPFVGGSK